MKDSRTRCWQALALFYAALLVVVCLLPSAALPNASVSDKTVHLLAYLGWVMVFKLAWPCLSHLRLWLAAFAFGVVIEGLQGLTPTRYFEGLDMLANGAGALLGILLLSGWQRLKGS
ncbi:VanZ family protein [Balneatrix alpica]|uniref:VanZ family protein n=1 Tax=Balneatrix alpica TaxID=75684 RepID=UPI00273A11A8|nr:VanZ family protein [Balneatrix alpica]